MEYYTEVKLMGDAYGAGFSNGLTMCGSQSAAAFRKVEDMGPDAVYDDDRQHRIVLHKKAAGQAVEVSTEFINESRYFGNAVIICDQGDQRRQDTQAAVFLECGRKTEDGIHRRTAFGTIMEPLWDESGKIRKCWFHAGA